jgi:hypothetical protein
VTAGIRLDGLFCKGDVQSVSRDGSTRFEIENPKRHRAEAPYRVRMEAGRVGGCEEKRLWMKITACGSKEAKLHSPFPFPHRESRGGRVPPTPQERRLPPQEGKPPCAIPQMDAREISLDSERPLMEAVCVNALVRLCAGGDQ